MIEIDNPATEDLLRRLAERSGRDVKDVLQSALRHQLMVDTMKDAPKSPKDTLSDEAREQFGDTPRASVEEMLEIGKLFVEHRSRPVQLSTDHGLWLYDEFGLPR